ncbi:uncharacterized protein LOC120509936, partial [Passer montanus]|uniref:uncharacterized protein LOC120509936 n=1 Tax=Passer montanus TaxID=9160 RepID=UPI00196093C0
MAEALGRWLREEMEVALSAVPSPAALRRFCSGPMAPVWHNITRHVRNYRLHIAEPTSPVMLRAARSTSLEPPPLPNYNSRDDPRRFSRPFPWFPPLRIFGVSPQEREEDSGKSALAAASPPSHQGELHAEVARLRKEVQDLGTPLRAHRKRRSASRLRWRRCEAGGGRSFSEGRSFGCWGGAEPCRAAQQPPGGAKGHPAK